MADDKKEFIELKINHEGYFKSMFEAAQQSAVPLVAHTTQQSFHRWIAEINIALQAASKVEHIEKLREHIAHVTELTAKKSDALSASGDVAVDIRVIAKPTESIRPHLFTVQVGKNAESADINRSGVHRIIEQALDMAAEEAGVIEPDEVEV